MKLNDTVAPLNTQSQRFQHKLEMRKFRESQNSVTDHELVRHDMIFNSLRKILELHWTRTEDDLKKHAVFMFNKTDNSSDIFKVYDMFYGDKSPQKYNPGNYLLQQANSHLARFNELSNNIRLGIGHVAKYKTRKEFVERQLKGDDLRET